MNKKLLVVGITLVLFAVAFGGCIQQNGTEETSGTVDSDGDGYNDDVDVFPNDSSEWLDSDNDGVGDNKDEFPNDSTESQDSDQDDYGDNSDRFPNDGNEWNDSDNDGVGDNSDDFPDNYLEWKDSDGDLIGDNYDPYPYDNSKWKDYSIPPEIYDISYNNIDIVIYNLKVETFGYNTNSLEEPGDKIGDGFVYVPIKYLQTWYVFSGVIENIGDTDIDEIGILFDFYDNNDDYVFGQGKGYHNIEKNKYYSFFVFGPTSRQAVGKIHHFTIEISESIYPDR